MSKEMNSWNLVPRAALYASATLAPCQSSLPMFSANPSMPCANAKLMSQGKVSEESHRRCRCTFFPVIKLVGVRVSYHHAGEPDNQKGRNRRKSEWNYCATIGLVEPVAYAEERRSSGVTSGKSQLRCSKRGNASCCRRVIPCAGVGCRWSAASAARICKDKERIATPGRMV